MDANAQQFFDMQAGSLANLKQHWNRITNIEMDEKSIDGFFGNLFASIFFSYQSETGNQYGESSVSYAADVIGRLGSSRGERLNINKYRDKKQYLELLKRSKGVYAKQSETKKVVRYLFVSCMEYEDTTGNEVGTFFIEVVIGFIFLLVSSESLGKKRDELAVSFFS